MAIDIDRILDAVVSNVAADGKLPDDDDEREEAIAQLRTSLSRYVIGPLLDEIVTNGEITVTVTTTTVGALDGEDIDLAPIDGMSDGIVMNTATSGTGSGTGTGSIS